MQPSWPCVKQEKIHSFRLTNTIIFHPDLITTHQPVIYTHRFEIIEILSRPASKIMLQVCARATVFHPVLPGERETANDCQWLKGLKKRRRKKRRERNMKGVRSSQWMNWETLHSCAAESIHECLITASGVTECAKWGGITQAEPCLSVPALLSVYREIISPSNNTAAQARILHTLCQSTGITGKTLLPPCRTGAVDLSQLCHCPHRHYTICIQTCTG